MKHSTLPPVSMDVKAAALDYGGLHVRLLVSGELVKNTAVLRNEVERLSVHYKLTPGVRLKFAAMYKFLKRIKEPVKLG